jgi:NAD(P)-dependent dehydrogenase (short-subunit alcohol dehydrogenase family)
MSSRPAAFGRRVITLRADRSDERELGGAADRLLTQLGDPAILVNNAANLTRGRLAVIDGLTMHQGWGRGIDIASDTLDRPPASGLTPYITSKGALIRMTRALARERVAEDDHGRIPFLASDASAVITAQTIRADTGLTFA